MVPVESAKNLFGRRARVVAVLVLMVSAYYAIIFPYNSFVTIILLGNIFFLSTMLFKILLFLVGSYANFFGSRRGDIISLPASLPIYTILVPLYKESRVIKRWGCPR